MILSPVTAQMKNLRRRINFLLLRNSGKSRKKRSSNTRISTRNLKRQKVGVGAVVKICYTAHRELLEQKGEPGSPFLEVLLSGFLDR